MSKIVILTAPSHAIISIPQWIYLIYDMTSEEIPVKKEECPDDAFALLRIGIEEVVYTIRWEVFHLVVFQNRSGRSFYQ